MAIDNLMRELLKEPVVQKGNSIVFTSRSIYLIHEIAKKCSTIPIAQKTQKQAEEYAEDLSAEQIFMNMLVKIVAAPTVMHMRLSANILMPIISRKLMEKGGYVS